MHLQSLRKNFVHFQPHEILCGAADEVLAVIKNDKLKDREKKTETEALVGPLPEERFAVFVNLAKKITDFKTEERTQATGISIDFFVQLWENTSPDCIPRITDENAVDDTYGINVQFEESEEEDDEDVYGEVRDEEMDEEGEEAKLSTAIHAENVSILQGYSSLIWMIRRLSIYIFL